MLHSVDCGIGAEELAVTTLALLISCILSCSNYSGLNNPPQFGDYEAQRHWMELSVNLPFSEIYKSGSQNNLSYWGVDYPPLTVYHSFILGKVKQNINADWVELQQSVGYQSYGHKFFMRSSVIICWFFIYLPASFLFSSKLKNKAFVNGLLLLNPGLLLIDNAHFQYNAVSLGFFILCVNFLIVNKIVFGSICFCLALNYKQMELYHSLPIFCYLLSFCCERSVKHFFIQFTKLSSTVLISFALLWLPYLESKESVQQVFNRLFPLNRGLFEDKVANLWCTLNNVVKIRLIFDRSHLTILSALVTLFASLPSCLLVFKKRSLENFFLSLASTSLSFYLFSYQVHEKSILLFCIPLIFLSNQLNGNILIHYLSICSLSMCHLYAKDEFLLAGITYTVLFSVMFHYFQSSIKTHRSRAEHKSFIIVSWSGFLAIVSLIAFAPPPRKLPDIYVVLLCGFSFLHFFIFYLSTLVMVVQRFKFGIKRVNKTN